MTCVIAPVFMFFLHSLYKVTILLWNNTHILHTYILLLPRMSANHEDADHRSLLAKGADDATDGFMRKT